MSFPDAIKALPQSAVDQIHRAVFKIVHDEEVSLGADKLWEDHFLVEGNFDPATVKVGKLYVKCILVKPKEWGGQRATVFADVFLCGAFKTENADGDSDLLGTRVFFHYASLLNTNIQLYDALGQKINVPVMEWDAGWARVAPGRGYRLLEMRFRYQTDIDPRDGSFVMIVG
jgi:hypothetical protein